MTDNGLCHHRLQRHRPRSRTRRSGPHCALRADRSESAAHADESIVPIDEQRIRPSENPSRTPSRSRCSGASPSPPRAVDACSSTRPTSCFGTFTARAAALRPGTYRVERSRSAFYLPRTKAFPKNTEIEMILTFVNDAAGGRGGGGGPQQGPPPIGESGGRGGGGGGRGGGLFSGTVASVTPAPEAVTLREHVSLVELPDNDYQAAVGRSARRLRRAHLRRLQRPNRRADADPLHPPPSPREEGSERRDERACHADSVLGRRGRAGRCEKGPRSKGRAGGTRHSRRRGSATPSRSMCCRTAPTRWTSATT